MSSQAARDWRSYETALVRLADEHFDRFETLVREARAAGAKRPRVQARATLRDEHTKRFLEILSDLRGTCDSKDARWETFLAALADGATITAAADAAGLPISTVNRRRRTDPEADRRVCAARRDGGDHAVLLRRRGPVTGRPSVMTPEVKRRVVAAVRAGATLGEAAERARVGHGTIKKERHRDPEFDLAVVEAGLLAGRRFQVLRKPRCPGPACGTSYGYDVLGCRQATCREEKVAVVQRSRGAGV